MLDKMSSHSLSSTEAALGLPVDVRNIETALKKLWEDDQASTKASLVNFAIFSEEPDTLQRNTEWIRKITSETACRAILIDADFDTAHDPEVNAWVTAHCHLQGGAKSICSEQISFRLKGRMTGRMRNVIFAHLDSDLPLFFWWQGRLSKSLAFEPNVSHQIDRLFVDSGSWGHGAAIAEEIDELNKLITERGSHVVINDLSWTRLLPFRKAVVSLFDDPRMSSQLDGLDHLHVSGDLASPATTLLLVAWISSSLKWELESSSDDGFSFITSSDQTRKVTLNQTDSGEAIDAFSWAGSAGEIVLEFSDQQRNYLSAAAKVSAINDRELIPTALSNCPDLVMTQLARATRDELYRGVLPMFRELASAMS